MAFCYTCGREVAEVDSKVPVCPVHGPLWLLWRNATSASAVIVDGDLVLLTRRARAPWKGYWETPGGYVERGEHPEQAVKRELNEELGAKVKSTELLGIYLDEWLPNEWNQTTVYVVGIEDTRLDLSRAEIVEACWFEADRPPTEMASNHRIRLSDWLERRG